MIQKISKFVVLAIALSIAITGCSFFGVHSEEKLLKKVAFDKDCPVDQIKVVNSVGVGLGKGDFEVQACEKKYKYMYTGSVYFEIK